MTADMRITRKSDGLILSDVIVDWEAWEPLEKHFEHLTQAGTYYPQNLGYGNDTWTFTAMFARHYPNSTPARFHALRMARRRNHTLRVRDYDGDEFDVRVFGDFEPGERWKEVPTRTIVKRKITVIRLSWVT